MKGLELSKAYFEQYGLPMLKAEFQDKLDKIAVGLVGHGSECFGYDDDISRDHDYEPGFCLWIDDESDKDFGFRLFRAYSKLPKAFCGFEISEKSIGGADFHGVKTIREFYSYYLGSDILPQTNREWMAIPDFYLAEATNGEVFLDTQGEFTRIREYILHNRPEDVRIKKLSSALFLMAQSGQYNYSRCMAHGEKTAAALALSDFVKNTVYAVFLLNKKYCPYYKWMIRAMRELDTLGDISVLLDKLCISPLDITTNSEIVENISAKIIKTIKKEYNLSNTGEYLEPYAYALEELIKDNELRLSPIVCL